MLNSTDLIRTFLVLIGLLTISLISTTTSSHFSHDPWFIPIVVILLLITFKEKTNE